MRPDVTIITNTGDRHLSFALCEHWMRRQRFDGVLQWIVTDDGKTPTRCTMGQHYLRREPHPSDPEHTQTINLELAMQEVQADRILIVEDDDYYGPTYVQRMMEWLQAADLVGELWAKYYSLEHQGWILWDSHTWASLCRTGIGPGAMDCWRQSIPGDHSHDRRLWAAFEGQRYEFHDQVGDARLCVGVKGMPGRRGCSWADWPYNGDRDHAKLKQWVGDDWCVYAEMMERMQR